jgi:phosphatidylinositol glycan class O
LTLFITSSLIALVYIRLFSQSENLNGTAKIIVSRWLPLTLLCSWAYWSLDTLEGHGIHLSSSFKLLHFGIPRYILPFLFFCGLFIWASDSITAQVEILESSESKTQLIPQKNSSTLLIRGLANSLGASYLTGLLVLLAPLIFIQKPMGATMITLGAIQLALVLELCHYWRDKAEIVDWGTNAEKAVKLKKDQGGSLTSKPTVIESANGVHFLFSIVLFLLGQRFFFSTGHERTLSSIQYEVGFLGLEKVNWFISPILILFNTYGGQVLFNLGIPLLVIWKRPALLSKEREALFMDELWTLMSSYSLLLLINITSSTVFAGHFKRHLMVWRVFAPKFIFTGVETGVAFVILLLSIAGFWMVCREYKRLVFELSRITGKKLE